MRHTTYTAADVHSIATRLRHPRHAPGVSQDVHATRALLERLPATDTCMHVTYKAGEYVVNRGITTSRTLTSDPHYAYAAVPLGVILSGEVIVLQNGMSIRRLLPGDFVGLFETSFYLSTHGIRPIGTWSLVADADVSILYLGKRTITRRDHTTAIFRNSLVDLSQRDEVPKPITDLPVLDTIANAITPALVPDTIVIVHSHLLPSNVGLIRHIAHLVGFQNVFMLEKPYSTTKTALTRITKMGVSITPVIMIGNAPYGFSHERGMAVMWQQVVSAVGTHNIQRIVILDDGGTLLRSVPWERLTGITIRGVEQTRRGIRQLERTHRNFPPTVNVASSTTKIDIESPVIARGVVSKLASTGLLDTTPRIGIIGDGAIGHALRHILTNLGTRPSLYDIKVHTEAYDHDGCNMTSVDSIFEASDIIIGCTGEDVTRGVSFDRVFGHKTLVSASSKDVEFFSLINRVGFSQQPFATVTATIHPGLTVDILNGGYPINFDREHEWEPAEDMQVTRSLMYAGFIQALNLPADAEGIVELDATIQKKIVTEWKKARKPVPVPRRNIQKCD